MSKEYTFKGKTYVAQPEKFDCSGCAFEDEKAVVCKNFERKANAPKCHVDNLIFIEKKTSRASAPPIEAKNDSVLQYRKETSWGIKPSANNVEIRTNRVIADNKHVAQTWSFQLKMASGYRPASISVTASKTAENCKFIAAPLPDTERFIVCLIENGNLAPSTSPKQHKSRESAENEAARLCKLYHQEFAVLQVVSAIKPQEPKKEVFA